jgi:pyrimidine operon attenuation protein/uracil phosphoribosyltransferase
MSDNHTGVLVLNESDILQKVKRIAFEIAEENYLEEEIFLVGLQDKGTALAKLLLKELEQIASFKIYLVQLTIDKTNLHDSHVILDYSPDRLAEKVIILVDDVINTASTALYSLKPFLDVPVKKIEIAVLVNRSHTRFPIAPTYTGLELATTLEDHINCSIEGRNLSVYLD